MKVCIDHQPMDPAINKPRNEVFGIGLFQIRQNQAITGFNVI